jgi:hypothetical protein
MSLVVQQTELSWFDRVHYYFSLKILSTQQPIAERMKGSNYFFRKKIS